MFELSYALTTALINFVLRKRQARKLAEIDAYYADANRRMRAELERRDGQVRRGERLRNHHDRPRCLAPLEDRPRRGYAVADHAAYCLPELRAENLRANRDRQGW